MFLLEKGTEEEHVTHALKSNGYLAQFIRSQSKPTRKPDTVSRPKATVVLPYVRHISETIRRILTPLEIRTCFKPHQTLRQLLVHPKDPIPPPCRDEELCTKYLVHHAQRCTLARPAVPWNNASRNTKGALTSGPAISAIAEHALNTNHDIDWANASVVGSHPRLHPRCAFEAWHIRSHKNTP